MKNGLTTEDKTASFLRDIQKLVTREVLVGVPSDKAERKEKGEPINNAQIGYIHEYGAPAKNIPARPHLVPGVRDAEPKVVPHFAKAAQAILRGDEQDMIKELNSAGLKAVSSVKGVLNAGINPPLSDSTLKARARRGRKGAIAELAARERGEQAGVGQGAKPLIDTSEYRDSITYVIAQK